MPVNMDVVGANLARVNSELASDRRNPFLLHQRACINIAQGKHSLALRDINLALTQKSDLYGHLYTQRGMVNLMTNKTTLALRDFSRALIWLPDYPLALRYRNFVLYETFAPV